MNPHYKIRQLEETINRQNKIIEILFNGVELISKTQPTEEQPKDLESKRMAQTILFKLRELRSSYGK